MLFPLQISSEFVDSSCVKVVQKVNVQWLFLIIFSRTKEAKEAVATPVAQNNHCSTCDLEFNISTTCVRYLILKELHTNLKGFRQASVAIHTPHTCSLACSVLRIGTLIFIKCLSTAGTYAYGRP